MAHKVKATLVDDITGDAAVETVNFGLDGVEFEIDLSANNAGILPDIFANYANAGRKVGKRAAVSTGRSRRSAAPRGNREQTAAIRARAREVGRQVSDRGRISGEVTKAGGSNIRFYRRSCAGAGTGECSKASAARTLEGDEHAVHTTRPDTALDLDCGNGLELPPVVRLIVKDLLKLVTGHLAPEQALAKLHHLVLVTGHHSAS
jgi:hypothetical protein